MKNQIKSLVVNSFSFQATVAPYSASYLVGYLKSQRKVASQIDVNMIAWNEILSYDYLKDIMYNKDIISELDCPFCPTLEKKEFEVLKEDVLSNITLANQIIRSKDIYNFEQFCFAQKIYFNAFSLIYHQYGTFLTTHMPYWGNQVGFKYNNIEDIYKIATDEKKNPLINIYKRIVLPLIKEIKPDIIFSEIMFPFDVIGALTLNILLKEQLPNIHINYSGISFDEFNFSRVRDNLEKSTKFLCSFDSVFVYRNDIGLIKLLERLENQSSLFDIDNLAYRVESKVVLNKMIDSQPYDDGIIPDYSDLDLRSYFVPEPVFVDRLSTRCFWAKCSFCSINAHKSHKEQFHNIQNSIKKIIILQQQYNVRYFWFLDEACPMEQALKFARELKKNKLDIFWSLRTRIDKEITKETLEELYASGLRELWIGLEHVNQSIIEKMNKTKDAFSYKDNAATVLNNAAEVGIGIHFCHIFGFPSETKEQREEIIDFYIENKESLKKTPFFGTLNIYGLAVDSPVYNDPEKYGIVSIGTSDDSFVVTQAPYITKWEDQTSNPQILHDIDEFSNRLMKCFVNDPELEYLWAVIADSPYELLFKANFNTNPFL